MRRLPVSVGGYTDRWVTGTCRREAFWGVRIGDGVEYIGDLAQGVVFKFKKCARGSFSHAGIFRNGRTLPLSPPINQAQRSSTGLLRTS